MTHAHARTAATLAAATLASAALAQPVSPGRGEDRAFGEAAAASIAPPTLGVALPPEVVAAQGDSNEGTSLGLFSNTAQIVYSAEMLTGAGIEPGDLITGLVFRVNGGDPDDGGPAWSVDDYQIRMSTAANPPEALASDLAANRGDDYLVVRSGPLSYDGTQHSVGGPYSGFGPEIGFQQPFAYVGGDLLVEYTHGVIASGGLAGDAQLMPIELGASVFAPGFDGTDGGGASGQVTVVRLSIDRGVGACFIEGACYALREPDCQALGGTFQGAGTTCASAGPPNDLICDAAPVGEGTIAFDTSDATRTDLDLPDACDEGFGVEVSRDLWYRFVPTASGTLVVSTCDQAEFDTRLAAYTGACDGTLTLLACDDDAGGCSDFTSLMEFTVSPGVPVLIRVGGFADFDFEVFGSGSLTLTFSPCPFDADGSGSVDFNDLVSLLSAFGGCP